jgi:hypothetical protein
MRIHSNFHDYYDTAMGYGQDPALHYDRKERAVHLSELKAQPPQAGVFDSYLYRRSRYLDFSPRGLLRERLIGFCGVVYPCLARFKNESDKKATEFIYTTERARELIADKEGASWYRLRRERAYKFPEPFNFDAMFVELSAPIFVAYNHQQDVRLVTNACLKDVEFYKVKDAFTAFQDIAGYLGNQLVKRDGPLDVADKYRIAQHGFDKWSFRKPPA